MSLNATTNFLQEHHEELVRLENADCIQAYGQSPLIDYANLLLVTNTTNNNSVLNLNYVNDIDVAAIWMCSNLTNGASQSCNTSALLADAATWSVYGTLNNNLMGLIYESGCPSWNPDEMFHVDYCLAQPTLEACSIGVALNILIVVLVCNAIKALCLFWTSIRVLDFEPLLTIGDAVASFLEGPDPTTANLGSLEADASSKLSEWPLVGEPWKGRNRSGFSSSAPSWWIISLVL